MIYKITDESHPMFGKIFDGKVVEISGEKRIWNNETVGQSYPYSSCTLEMSQTQESQLLSLKAHYPFRICFAALDDSGDFQLWQVGNKRKMKTLAMLGYTIYSVQ